MITFILHLTWHFFVHILSMGKKVTGSSKRREQITIPEKDRVALRFGKKSIKLCLLRPFLSTLCCHFRRELTQTTLTRNLHFKSQTKPHHSQQFLQAREYQAWDWDCSLGQKISWKERPSLEYCALKWSLINTNQHTRSSISWILSHGAINVHKHNFYWLLYLHCMHNLWFAGAQVHTQSVEYRQEIQVLQLAIR